jgi:CrcB protein
VCHPLVFGVKLNSFFPSLPPGTLVVNLLGAFIIGAAMAYFMRNPQLDPPGNC